MIVKNRPCRCLAAISSAYEFHTIMIIRKTIYCDLSSTGKILWKLMARCDGKIILKY